MAFIEKVPYGQVRFTNFEGPFSAHIVAADGETARETSVSRPILQSGVFLYHNDTLVITQDRNSVTGSIIGDYYQLVSGTLTRVATLVWNQNYYRSVRFKFSVTTAGDANRDSTVAVTSENYWK